MAEGPQGRTTGALIDLESILADEEYIAPSEFEDGYEQARRIPPRDCPWLYQLPEEIRRAKDLNNREPLNREPNNLCSYKYINKG